MGTDFFYKKRFLFSCLSIVFILIAEAVYSYCFYPYIISYSTHFHFLVSEDTRVEASAEFIKLEGGAGYLLRENGRDYVVLSVYLEKADGLAVQEVLATKNTKTRLISIGIDRLVFRGKKESEKSSLYLGALQSLYGCLCVLEQTVECLEKGMTQGKTKEILSQLKAQLFFMADVYANPYGVFAALCRSVATKLAEKSEGIVYTNKLRYLLCETVEGYLRVAKNFT